MSTGAQVLGDGRPDGTKVVSSATEKLHLYGGTPVAQASTLTVPATTAATSTSPYGFTSSQANAILTWIAAMDVATKNIGLQAAS